MQAASSHSVGLWLTLTSGAFVLWMGLFIITRDPRHLRAWLAGLAMIAISFLPFGEAIYRVSLSAPNHVFWERLVLVSVPIASGLWFHVAVTLAIEVFQPRQRRWQILGWAATGLGLLLALANSAAPLTEIEELYRGDANSCQALACIAGPDSYSWVYWLSVRALQGGSSLVYALTFLRARRQRHPSRISLQWLLLAAVMFFLTGLALDTYRLHITPLALFQLLLIVSLALLGWSIAKYNALFQARVLEQDLLMSLGVLGLILLAYNLIPLGLSLWFVRLQLISSPLSVFQLALGTGMAVITHLFIDQVRLRLDSLFDDENRVRLRGEIIRLIQDSREGLTLEATFIQLDQIKTRSLIHQHINKQLLRELDSPDATSALAASPLQSLRRVQTMLSIEEPIPDAVPEIRKAGAIVQLLDQALRRLEEADGPNRPRRNEQLSILRLRITQGLDRATIIRRMNIHPRQYDRLLNYGISQLADAVFEMEYAYSAEG